MSQKSVFCIANCRHVAELIVDQLRFYNVSGKGISILYPDTSKNGVDSAGFGDPDELAAHASRQARYPDTAIGGSMGSLGGITILLLPGLGNYIAAGPLLDALGGAAPSDGHGCIGEGLLLLGLTGRKARHYEDRVRLGNILIAVHTECPAEAMQSKFIFTRARAQDICINEEASVSRWQGVEEIATRHAAFSHHPAGAGGGYGPLATPIGRSS